MQINSQLAYEVYKRRGQNGVPDKKYSFLLNQTLGEHGNIEGHPFLGKTIINNKTQKKYVIDNVCLHWYTGYYWSLTAKDENDSHMVRAFENANCIDDIICNGINKFFTEYTILSL